MGGSWLVVAHRSEVSDFIIPLDWLNGRLPHMCHRPLFFFDLSPPFLHSSSLLPYPALLLPLWPIWLVIHQHWQGSSRPPNVMLQHLLTSPGTPARILVHSLVIADLLAWVSCVCSAWILVPSAAYRVFQPDLEGRNTHRGRRSVSVTEPGRTQQPALIWSRELFRFFGIKMAV